VLILYKCVIFGKNMLNKIYHDLLFKKCSLTVMTYINMVIVISM